MAAASRKRSGRHIEEAREYRGWYKTARWQATRQHQLALKPLCEMCERDGTVKAATVVDHVTPHRGDERLFWSGPFQSLCKDCHDQRKRLIDIRGYEPGSDVDGRPKAADHPWNRSKS